MNRLHYVFAMEDGLYLHTTEDGEPIVHEIEGNVIKIDDIFPDQHVKSITGMMRMLDPKAIKRSLEFFEKLWDTYVAQEFVTEITFPNDEPELKLFGVKLKTQVKNYFVETQLAGVI